MRPIRFFTFLAMLLLCLNLTKGAIGDVTLDTVPNYNGWGWDALVVDNGIIQLVVIPDIGGRIMFYGFEGDEYIAVNDGQVGNDYDPNTNNYGPWTSWGYGGYKCWPAPQSRWNWPPPPHLDWGVYTYSIEHASSDSIVIFMESPVETKLAAGLQQARRIKAYKNSTKISIEEILKNVSNTNNTWSIWEVTQAWPKHEGLNDNTNISTYFHAKASDVKKLQNGNITTTAVNDSIRKYNENNSGKIGILVNPGWCCYVDERDEQSYAKVFDVYPDKTYPDNNTNLQFYAGTNYTEIEVLSPMYDLAQGSTVSFTEYWFASHFKGAMQNINHAGSILGKLSVDSELDIITGQYGIYNTGKLKLLFSNNGTELLSIDTFNVSAAEKYNLNVNQAIPSETSRLDLIAFDYNGNLIDTIDTWLPNAISGIEESSALPEMEIYPTFVEPGTLINIQFKQIIKETALLSIRTVNGQLIDQKLINSSESSFEYEIPQLSSGIYLVTFRSGNSISNAKIIVK